MVVSIPEDAIAKVAQGEGRVVIASSRGSEQSWESESQQNSYFTHYLLEAMRQKDGLANVTEIFTHLQRTVPSAVQREKANRRPRSCMWIGQRKAKKSTW